MLILNVTDEVKKLKTIDTWEKLRSWPVNAASSAIRVRTNGVWLQ
jgi:hypothetical protein